jgi:hypothetical protein
MARRVPFPPSSIPAYIEQSMKLIVCLSVCLSAACSVLSAFPTDILLHTSESTAQSSAVYAMLEGRCVKESNREERQGGSGPAQPSSLSFGRLLPLAMHICTMIPVIIFLTV